MRSPAAPAREKLLTTMPSIRIGMSSSVRYARKAVSSPGVRRSLGDESGPDPEDGHLGEHAHRRVEGRVCCLEAVLGVVPAKQLVRFDVELVLFVLLAREGLDDAHPNEVLLEDRRDAPQLLLYAVPHLAHAQVRPRSSAKRPAGARPRRSGPAASLSEHQHGRDRDAQSHVEEAQSAHLDEHSRRFHVLRGARH